MQQMVKLASGRIARRAARGAQRGASLLEAIAYLGIAAIVVIGAVALLNGAFSSAGTNELSEQVNAIQAGVKKLYMGQTAGYTGISNATLKAAGVFPSTISLDSKGNALDNWGGELTVTSSAAGTFQISYASVPSTVCINALTTVGSWVSIQAGATTITTFPVTPDAAATDCGTAPVTMIWTSV